MTAKMTHRLGPGLVLMALLIGLAVSGCVTPGLFVETPGGFALFDDEADPTAISPEGFFRVRDVANQPVQDLDFWSRALERQMIESGYVLISDGEFETPVGPGEYYEWLAPVGEEDWIYLTGVVVTDDRIVISEAAGRFDLYDKRREALLGALETVDLTEPDG